MAVIADEAQSLRDSLKVSPPDTIEYLNLLDYGDPGVGKTYLIGTAEDSPNTSPVLILDVEGGLTTIRERTGVDTISIRSMTELENVYNKLYHSIKTDEDGKPYILYKTVGIDSLTELAALDMKVIMQQAFDKNPDNTDKDVPDQRAWGKSREHIRTIVRAFRDLPCNVIYTASVGTLQEEGEPTKYFPAFAGKLRSDVPGFMDIVGYHYAETVGIGESATLVRKVQFQGTRKVVAKDRTGKLGPFIVNPTIPMMWDLIHGIVSEPETETPILSIITDNSKEGVEV